MAEYAYFDTRGYSFVKLCAIKVTFTRESKTLARIGTNISFEKNNPYETEILKMKNTQQKNCRLRDRIFAV